MILVSCLCPNRVLLLPETDGPVFRSSCCIVLGTQPGHELGIMRLSPIRVLGRIVCHVVNTVDHSRGIQCL
jgi:hypothetical protein